MSKDMLIALCGGALSGLISLALVMGFPGAMLAVYLTPLPLFLIGFAFGANSGTVAGGAGIITAGFFGGVLSGLLFALIYALPVWLVVRLALTHWQTTDKSGDVKEEWVPTGAVLGMLAIFAATLLVMAYLLGLGQEGGLQGTIHSILEKIFTYLMPSLQDSERANLLGGFALLFPGYLGMSWVVMTIVNATIALAVLNRMKASARPTPRISGLTLPDRASWLLIGTASLTLIGSVSGHGDWEYIGRNLVMISALPFFFLGLAVVHDLARVTPYPGVMLASFYIFLLISGWIALIIIAAGLMEQWYGIRRLFKASDQSQV